MCSLITIISSPALIQPTLHHPCHTCILLFFITSATYMLLPYLLFMFHSFLLLLAQRLSHQPFMHRASHISLASRLSLGFRSLSLHLCFTLAFPIARSAHAHPPVPDYYNSIKRILWLNVILSGILRSANGLLRLKHQRGIILIMLIN